MRIVLKTFALLLLAAFTACDTVPVAEQLDQGQAREVVSELSKFGISAVAEKGSGGRAQYDVMVRGVQYHQAVQLLQDRSLPRETKASFAEIVEPRGLTPNSREMESLRLDRAMAIELEEILGAYPGVKTSKVLLRLNFREDAQPPAVSVLLKVEDKDSINFNDLFKIVKRTVPGVLDENVEIVSHVETEYAEGSLEEVGALRLDRKVVILPLIPFLYQWLIPEGHYRSLVFVLIGIIFLVLAIGALLGYWYGIYAGSHQILDSDNNKAPPNQILSVDTSRRKSQEG